MRQSAHSIAESLADPLANKFERRREAVIQAAVEPLNRHGVRGMTFAHVAAKLDLVPTAIGYYFRRKEDLAAACLLEGVRRLEGLLDDAMAESEPARRVATLVTDFFEFRRRVAVGEEDEIAWFEDVRTIKDPAVNEAFVRMFRQTRTLLASPDDGAAERIGRNARTHLLLSQLFWAVLWLPRYHPEDYGRMGARLLDILTHGFAAGGFAARKAAWAPRPLTTETAWSAGGEISREAFLRVATQLINEEGYLGASVQKICHQLGVTKGSFYHHNENKDGLVVQCFERTWTILRQTQAAADSCDSGLQTLAAFAAHLVQGQVTGRNTLLRTSALSAVPEDIRPRLIAGFERTGSRLASVVSDGVADGSIRPIDALIGGEAINGAINAASELHHWAPELEPAEAADHYLRPLFLGLFSQGRAA